jgi:hypothetical protein
VFARVDGRRHNQQGLLTEVILAIPVEGYHHPTRLMRANFQNPIPRD